MRPWLAAVSGDHAGGGTRTPLAPPGPASVADQVACPPLTHTEAERNHPPRRDKSQEATCGCLRPAFCGAGVSERPSAMRTPGRTPAKRQLRTGKGAAESPTSHHCGIKTRRNTAAWLSIPLATDTQVCERGPSFGSRSRGRGRGRGWGAVHGHSRRKRGTGGRPVVTRVLTASHGPERRWSPRHAWPWPQGVPCPTEPSRETLQKPGGARNAEHR